MSFLDLTFSSQGIIYCYNLSIIRQFHFLCRSFPLISNAAVVFSSTRTLPIYNDAPTIEMLPLLISSRIFSYGLLLASLRQVKAPENLL